jgi:hypothetical protein
MAARWAWSAKANEEGGMKNEKWGKSSKHQPPNSNETPNFKLQHPRETAEGRLKGLGLAVDH